MDRLDSEPSPVQNTVELQRVLAENGHNVSFKKRPREKQLIVLVFPDDVLGEERLLMLDNRRLVKARTTPCREGMAGTRSAALRRLARGAVPS